ncbi:MAG: metal ABC transporter ATP-binding protein [bacterium]|nr:metal ABC transporter ATP-binding protein [bacterium]
MKDPAITLENVTIELGGKPVIENVSAQIEKGMLTAIMGPNGAGKTTLLHAILGLRPYRGKISFGSFAGARRPRIGYVPQKVDLDRGSPITVCDFLISGLTTRPLWLGSRKPNKQECLQAAERVGVGSSFHTPIGKVSGGELQRVLLAQALLGNPEVLLLDEPAAAVDISGEAMFCELLQEVHNDLGLTTLLVTHDLSVVTTHAHYVLCVNRTLICAGTTEEVMTTENLNRVFSPHMNLFMKTHDHQSINHTKDHGPAA